MEPQPTTYDFSYISLIMLLLTFMIFISESFQLDHQRMKQVLESLDAHFISNQSDGDIMEKPQIPDPFTPEAAMRLQTTRISKLRPVLASIAEQNGISFTESGRSFSFIFPNDRLFSESQDQLAIEYLQLLQRIAREVSSADFEVKIEVHTDNFSEIPARYSSRLHFTASRAASLYRYLLDGGASPGRLTAMGYGEFNPVSVAQTDDNRAANRRTIVTLCDGESEHNHLPAISTGSFIP